MAGYNRPEGGWHFVYDGLNTLDAPDAIQPTQYPYARNIRGLAERKVRARPGYTLFSSSPSITTECPLTPGQEDAAYSDTMTVTGGIAPYTWSILTGALPSGLTLSSAGVISGTPTIGGLFSFTLRVTDAAGGADALSCSLYVCPAGSGGSDWSGCLAGSFTIPADWTQVSSVAVSGGQCQVFGQGYVYNTLGGCGAMLNTEVYTVYNTKTTGAGNHGYQLVGPGARMGGTNTGNLQGYFFVAQMWGGTISNTCGWDGSALIALQLLKVVSGSGSLLTGTSIAGPDLTPGIPMALQCSVEGSGARLTAFLGGTQMLTALDSSAVLSQGYPGIGGLNSCSGVVPATTFSFFKARVI